MMRRILCFALAAFFVLSCAAIVSAAESIIPTVNAKAAVLLDAQLLRVMYEKNADLRLPMASTTKIMTAITAIECGELDQVFEIPQSACGVEGSSVYLTPGENLTLTDLLYALMLASANDAATAIAVCVSGSVEAFCALMNEKAEMLGLVDTHFENPHGLDSSEHYTTAYELGKLTAYALKNETFAKIVATQKYKIPGPDGTVRYLVNHNKLLSRYEGCIGVKTGFTKKSGRCLVSAAERDGMRLVCVTLSDGDDWNDHAKLLDYGFRYYSSVTLCQAGQSMYELCVAGRNMTVNCVAEDTVRLTLPYGADKVKVRIECPRFLWEIPENGEKLGRAVFLKDGKTIAECDIVADVKHTEAEDEEEKGFFSFLRKIFGGK